MADVKKAALPEYNTNAPLYAEAALGVAIAGVAVALSTPNATLAIGAALTAIIAVGVYHKIVAYQMNHPDGLKSNPNLSSYVEIGAGEGVTSALTIVTAIMIRAWIVI